MADTHVIFGSSSDAKVYERILKQMSSAKLSICSAHRTPEMLDEILKSSHAKVFIAGAGLAAHLPGVIASKTLKPVIGVPVNSNFYGLDSLMSIMQMPKGIPVMTVDIDGENAANAAKQILSGLNGVNIIGDQKNKRVSECVSLLTKFGVHPKFESAPVDGAVNILFEDLDEFNVLDDSAFIINVPLKEKSIAMDAVELVELTEKGVWVGLNRGDNAALAAVQCLNLDGRHTAKIQGYRDELKQQIIDENKKLGGHNA